MIALVGQCVLIGVTGAFTVAVIDSVMTRVPRLNGKLLWRATSRLAIAGAAAYAAHLARAPSFVPTGILAGTILVTALDAAIALMPLRKLSPPPVSNLQSAALPWGPLPMYTVPTQDYALPLPD